MDRDPDFIVNYRCLRKELKPIFIHYVGKFTVNEFILIDGVDEYRYVGFIVPRNPKNYILIPQLTRRDRYDLIKIKAIEDRFKLEVNPEDELR